MLPYACNPTKTYLIAAEQLDLLEKAKPGLTSDSSDFSQITFNEIYLFFSQKTSIYSFQYVITFIFGFEINPRLMLTL